MGKIAFALVAVAAATLVLAAPPASKIEARLSTTLQEIGKANVIVSFQDSTDGVLSQFHNAQFSTRDERTYAVVGALKSFATSQQKLTRAHLQSVQADHDIFWITNQIYIRSADTELINKLVQLDEVSEITEEFWIHLDPFKAEGAVEHGRNSVLAEWGVERVEAPAAWELPGGNRGQGAIIGSIDTGGHSTHVDLAANFRGTAYGWRDFTLLNSQTPLDNHGHGTHTIGTFAGANGLGVAPDAQWIACKALNAQGSGTNAGLVNCGQWMACPTLPNGQNEDCTKTPHVVNNSWGGGQANAFYNAVINAWHALNIIPVFANGNSGPACQTANSPADSLAGVFGVAATTDTNGVAEFSSKGPTIGGNAKPDIGAPGQAVRSAWNTPGDTAYSTLSGTSMAAPHVAGVIALLKSHNPNLTMAQARTLLYPTTTQEVAPTGMNCGGIDESTYPNMAVGHGIINARRALQTAIDGKY
jgi:subtilisin family serine protease